jgi:hypothetical protein
MSLTNRIPKSPLTKVSVNIRGVWKFVPTPIPQSAVFTTENFTLHQTKFEFGLVSAKQSDPTKLAKLGSKTDLLVVYKDLTLGIMPRAKYKRLYERQNVVQQTQAVSSTSKSRDKKLEEQGQKLVPLRSNTVVTPRATKLERPRYNPKDERGSRY